MRECRNNPAVFKARSEHMVEFDNPYNEYSEEYDKILFKPDKEKTEEDLELQKKYFAREEELMRERYRLARMALAELGRHLECLWD